MSIHLFARRGSALGLILALISCLAFAGRAAAGTLDVILGNNVTHATPTLELGNANKILVGRFNHVHSVFANVDSQQQTPISNIVYEHFDPLAQTPITSTSNPPNPLSTWDDFQLSSDNSSYLPAMALDTDGKAVVAWVSKPTPQSTLGSIWFRYQTGVNCFNCWSQPKQIVYYGTEPSIVAESGTVYLTWTTRDRVQLAKFPKVSPPATPLWLGDVVDYTNCPGSRFHQPSIALVHQPCNALDLKIATLFTANEQSSGGACHDASTRVGPRVYERDATTGAWSEVAFSVSEMASSSTPNQADPTALSISMNANRVTGDFFLAWSDALVSGTRTKLGHGKGTSWDFTPLDTLGHHVHVAAKSGGQANFRVAVSDDQGWGTGPFTQTGQWSGGSLSWTGIATPIPDSTYGFVESAQALYWSRCAAHKLQDMKAYTEADDYLPDGYNDIYTDYSLPVTSSCLISVGTAMPFPPCLQSHLFLSQITPVGGGTGVTLDVGDTAVILKLDKSGATIAALGGGTIQVTWEPAEVLSSWDNGFEVATRRDSVRFSSTDGASFDVEDLSPPTGGK